MIIMMFIVVAILICECRDGKNNNNKSMNISRRSNKMIIRYQKLIRLILTR